MIWEWEGEDHFSTAGWICIVNCIRLTRRTPPSGRVTLSDWKDSVPTIYSQRDTNDWVKESILCASALNMHELSVFGTEIVGGSKFQNFSSPFHLGFFLTSVQEHCGR